MLIFRWPRAEHGFQMVLVFLQSSFGVLDADVWNQDSKILAQLPVQLRGEILKNIHAEGILYTAAYPVDGRLF